MLSETRAREIAQDYAGSNGLGPRAIEGERGWFFAWDWGEPRIGGSAGLIVNKDTGRVMQLGGCQFGLDRDLAMYDQGMDADEHDLADP